jgi:hypothetical protein
MVIAKDGLLNDGQHRATAVVEANRCIPTFITCGVERASRTTVDQGAGRTAADYLGMEGVINSSVQAAIGRLVIAYERSGKTGLSGVSRISNAEIMRRVYDDPCIADAAHFAAKHVKTSKKFAAPALIGFCYYLFQAINPLEAVDYMTQVVRGEGIRSKDPAYTVRDRLFGMDTKSREKRIHVIIRGWNAYRQGRSLAMAKIVGDDTIPAVI